MELELGLKLRRFSTDITWELIDTATAFVLLVHLSGYKKDDIEISIDKESMKINLSIGGGRSIRDRIIMGRVTICRELEIARFRKSFQIPNGVVFEQIEVRFDDERGILSIFMPKALREEVLASGNGIERVDVEEEQDEGFMHPDQEEEDHKSEAPLQQGSETASDQDQEEISRPDEDPEGIKRDAELDRSDTSDESDRSELGLREEAERSGSGRRRARDSFYFPFSPPSILAGSAFILSVLSLVIQLLRNRKR